MGGMRIFGAGARRGISGTRRKRRSLVGGRKNGIEGNVQRNSTRRNELVDNTRVDGIIIGLLSLF
jgi:hypothetical protein